MWQRDKLAFRLAVEEILKGYLSNGDTIERNLSNGDTHVAKFIKR